MLKVGLFLLGDKVLLGDSKAEVLEKLRKHGNNFEYSEASTGGNLYCECFKDIKNDSILYFSKDKGILERILLYGDSLRLYLEHNNIIYSTRDNDITEDGCKVNFPLTLPFIGSYTKGDIGLAMGVADNGETLCIYEGYAGDGVSRLIDLYVIRG